MIAWSIYISLAMLFVATIIIIAEFQNGKNIIDRALSIDLAALASISIILLLSMQFKTVFFYDLILMGSIVPFIGSVVVGYVYSKKEAP